MSLFSPSQPPSLEEQVWRSQEKLKSVRRRSRWLWFFLLASILLNIWFYTLHLMHRETRKRKEGPVFVERYLPYLPSDESAYDKIAVIHLDGIISFEGNGHMGYDGMVGDIEEQLRLAVKDEGVRAIVLKVDSPGGEVLASDKIYRAVRNARKVKPVVCSMGSVAASGAYYAAMGSKWVVADDLTITGSIGVILETLNYKGLLDKVGVRTIVFKSGKFKDILNGGREPTPEEMQLVQSLISETYEQFLGIVARERRLDPDKLRNGIADGRIFSGKQALALGLIDQLGTFDDAVRKAKDLADIKSARLFDYVVPFSWQNVFGFLAESAAPKINMEIPPSMKLKSGHLYYLSLHLF